MYLGELCCGNKTEMVTTLFDTNILDASPCHLAFLIFK